MINRLLKIIRVILTNNPISTLRILIRLRPKLIVLFSAASLSLNLVLPSSFLSGLNIMSGLLTIGIINEYKRLLPFKIFNKQTFLKKTNKIDGKDLSFKSYDGFPVCTIKVISARARGRLIAENFTPQIVEVFDQYYNWLPTAVNLLYTGFSLTKAHTLPYYDQASPLYGTNLETYFQQKFLEMDFNFPESILEEFSGMLEVLEPYIQELNKNSIIERAIPTLDTMKLLCALPDILKTSPSEISVVHCTAVIRRLANGSMQHLRTLDYPSLGIIKQFSALYTWLAPTNISLASVSFLPFIAAISITNGYLSATINDAATTKTKRFEKNGIPETLCLRYALENCKTFAELDAHFQTNYPATTCSFAISSATDGRVYQMLPTDDNTRYYTVRPLSDQGSVVVTNHHYCSEQGIVNDQVNADSINWATTFKRECLAIAAIEAEKNWDQVLRTVDVPETAQSLCFQYPDKNRKSLELKLSVQNYHAADYDLDDYHNVPVGKILEDFGKQPAR